MKCRRNFPKLEQDEDIKAMKYKTSVSIRENVIDYLLSRREIELSEKIEVKKRKLVRRKNRGVEVGREGNEIGELKINWRASVKIPP